MRQFRLLTHDESKAFSLFGGSIIVTDVGGLGTNLELTKIEGADRYYISEMYADFEDITFTIYFGVQGNTYKDYNNLMSFIALNGKNKLILEYKTDEDSEAKYCDIWLRTAPKTQKDTTSTMNARFVFARLSPWYTKIIINFSMFLEYREVSFPLDIPIPFTGAITNDSYILENTYFEDYFLDIIITGPLNHDLTLTLSDVNSNIVHRVVVKKVLKERDWFRINGEDNKITYYDGDQLLTSNGYNDVDHNYDSFIVVPSGKYSFVVGLEQGDTCQVSVSYRRFMLD